MHRITAIFRWARINAAFLLTGFLLTGALVALLPQEMLRLFGSLARFYEALGARSASAMSSQVEIFSHILQRNAISGLAFFVVGLLLQAPLALILGGAFYGFIAFLAPYTIGRSFGPNDWLLITVEAAALVASASLASAFASELYGVRPSLSAWWSYFSKSWRSFSMQPVRSARRLMASWALMQVLGALVIGGLLLFVAWFETYGY